MYIPADPILTTQSLLGRYSPAAESLLEQQIPRGSPFLARGRVALWEALRAMGIYQGDTVLLPSYICDSVLGPIEAVGARPVFHDLNEQLELDLDAIEAQIEGSVKAVLAVHYYGFSADLAGLRSLCEARGVWLIEDCAHSLYSFHGTEPLGRMGHAAVFSPWKSLPIPDGGILVLNDSRLVRPDPLPMPSALSLGRRVAYRVLPTFETLVGWSPRSSLLEREALRTSLQNRDRSPDFAREAGSDFSRQILERTDGHDVRERRRANYQQLAPAATSQPYLHVMAPTLPEGVCPLGLPVLAENRDAARAHFLRRGINVRAYWERLPREVDRVAFPNAHRLSERILILPVHQSMTQRHIDHVIQAIHELPEGKTA